VIVFPVEELSTRFGTRCFLEDLKMMTVVLKKQPSGSGSGRPDSRCPIHCSPCDFENDVYPARFSELTLLQDGGIETLKKSHHHILFLLEGTLQIRLMGDISLLPAGQALFLARNTLAEIRAVEPSHAIVLAFSNRVVLGKYDWLAYIAARHRPRVQELIPMLKLDRMTIDMLRSIVPMWSPCYHVLKQYDLFMNLANSYRESELARFFHPILRASDDFEAFMLHNYTNGDSLEDIARKASLSKSYFMRRFKEVFGVTAHQWLVRQKKRELVRMISGGQTNTKTMADLLGFSNPAGLYQFCRKHFGCSITALMGRIDKNSAEVDREDIYGQA
jgi:AraC-like DNA-binding protein